MRKWQDRVDLFHVYHPPALPGAGMYKVLGGRRPVVASLESYAAFCPKAYEQDKVVGRILELYHQVVSEQSSGRIKAGLGVCWLIGLEGPTSRQFC